MKRRGILRRVGALVGLRWPLFALLGVALSFTGVSGVYFVRYLLKPNTGLVVNYPEAVMRGGRLLFAPKTPFSPAVAAGLVPYRDQILSVDGIPVWTLRDLVVAEARIWTFGPFPVEVLRDGDEPQVLDLRPAFNLTRPDWLFALVFCAALGFTAIYLLTRRPAEPAFVLIALAALFYLVFTAVKPFYYENRLSNALIHFGKLTSWFMVFFALYFPKPRGSRRFRLVLMASILALYGVFTVLRLRYFALWCDSTVDLWLARYRFLGQLANVSDGVAFALYAALLISAHLRTPHAQEKRQIEWILAGFLIAIPPYFFLDQLPIILGEPPGMRISMGNFANLFLAFVPLFFIVGLFKHRVFNLRFFLSRYVVYAALVVLLLGFFTTLYKPVGRLFMSSYGVPDSMAAFLVTTLLFLILVPLRYGLSSAADRLFYRRHYVKGIPYSATLERRNRELQLLIEKLTRESQRSFRRRVFPELREVLRGIALRMDTPTRRITAGLSEARRRLGDLPAAAQPSASSQPLTSARSTPAVWPSAHQRVQIPAPLEETTAREVGGGEDDGGGVPGAHDRHGDGHDRGQLRTILGEALADAAEIREFLGKLTAIIGRHASAPARVNVARLLAGVHALAAARHPQLAVLVRAPGRAKVVCHPGEIVQVLEHLIQNAAEALGPADGAVTVSAAEQEGYVAISVEDQGKGIEPRALRRVFEPFFSTKNGHDGLGLYFCRLIVERNSGSIEMQRLPQGGTRAVVLLPVPAVVGDPPPQEARE